MENIIQKRTSSFWNFQAHHWSSHWRRRHHDSSFRQWVWTRKDCRSISRTANSRFRLQWTHWCTWGRRPASQQQRADMKAFLYNLDPWKLVMGPKSTIMYFLSHFLYLLFIWWPQTCTQPRGPPRTRFSLKFSNRIFVGNSKKIGCPEAKKSQISKMLFCFQRL